MKKSKIITLSAGTEKLKEGFSSANLRYNIVQLHWIIKKNRTKKCLHFPWFSILES